MKAADLCHVCLQRPATHNSICDDCSPPWHTDAPTWTQQPKGNA